MQAKIIYFLILIQIVLAIIVMCMCTDHRCCIMVECFLVMGLCCLYFLCYCYFSADCSMLSYYFYSTQQHLADISINPQLIVKSQAKDTCFPPFWPSVGAIVSAHLEIYPSQLTTYCKISIFFSVAHREHLRLVGRNIIIVGGLRNLSILTQCISLLYDVM